MTGFFNSIYIYVCTYSCEVFALKKKEKKTRNYLLIYGSREARITGFLIFYVLEFYEKTLFRNLVFIAYYNAWKFRII